MELWIRSQDKLRLIKPNQLEIREDCLKNEDMYAIASINFQNTYGYNFLYLGSYKTKERALEVLDEIQREIIATPIIIPKHNNNDFQNNYYDLINKVYEMPKE